jgi:hypothetical protein
MALTGIDNGLQLQRGQLTAPAQQQSKQRRVGEPNNLTKQERENERERERERGDRDAETGSERDRGTTVGHAYTMTVFGSLGW